MSIYFESGSHSINESEVAKINLLENKLHGKGVSSLKIIGFTDDLGNETFNLELSKKRAESVKNHFELNSVQELLDTFIVEGKGEIQQSNLLKASVEAQRKMNRRVDVEVRFDSPSPIVMEEINKPVIGVKKLDNQLKVGDKIILKDVLFQGGTDYMFRESEEALDDLIFFMKDNPQYSITILGHVCCQYDGLDGLDRETGIRNLSIMRAKKVYEILISKGISKNRLEYKGMKGDFPTGLGEEADRRVEVEIRAIEK
jgi:outer membrane protein OmpA-like peptidoglycan-associated protein